MIWGLNSGVALIAGAARRRVLRVAYHKRAVFRAFGPAAVLAALWFRVCAYVENA